MAKFKVDLKEFDALMSKVKELQAVLPGGPINKQIRGAFKVGIDDFGKEVLKLLRDETPRSDTDRPDYHTGSKFHKDNTALADSWQWKLEAKGSKLLGGAFVEDDLNKLVDLLTAGSPPHTISPRAGGVLRFYVRHGGGWEEVTSRGVSHPGFPANPFIEVVNDKMKPMVDKISAAVQKQINNILVGR